MNVDDQATAREELDRELAMRAKRQGGPEPTGCCLNCGEAVANPHRWCDPDCFHDWEARTKRGVRP